MAGVITARKMSSIHILVEVQTLRMGRIEGDIVKSLILLLYDPISWRYNMELLLRGFVMMIFISSLSSVRDKDKGSNARGQ